MPMRRAARAFAVLPDGKPDVEHLATGAVIDVSKGGIGLELDRSQAPTTRDLIVGVEDENGAFHFAGAQVKRQSDGNSPVVRVGCRIGGIAAELLEVESEQPKFDRETMTFRSRFDEDVLEAWRRVGVLEPFFVDRVELCPRCGSLPTFRPACRQCGSAAVENDVLIHHFACAHVGPVSDFEKGPDLVCPKCRQRQLIVNSDFDYVAGPYRCRECQWTDMELESMGRCLACGHQFPASEAKLQDLRGYHARRLEPLAIDAAS